MCVCVFVWMDGWIDRWTNGWCCKRSFIAADVTLHFRGNFQAADCESLIALQAAVVVSARLLCTAATAITRFFPLLSARSLVPNPETFAQCLFFPFPSLRTLFFPSFPSCPSCPLFPFISFHFLSFPFSCPLLSSAALHDSSRRVNCGATIRWQTQPPPLSCRAVCRRWCPCFRNCSR